MSNIETGRTKPSLTSLIAIANALDTSVDYFLCDNVIKSDYIFKDEVKEILSDCEDYELRIITKVLSVTKESIRHEIDFRKRLFGE